MNFLAPWRNTSAQRPSLTGSKVSLRMPAPDDYEEWSHLRLGSRSFLEPWEPSWDHQELSKEAFRSRVKRYQQLRKDDAAYAYFIFQGERLSGAITLSNVRRGISQMGTLGYWIGADFARQGLMSDALAVMCAHAFRELNLHRLEAACLPRNTASIRLLEKTNFEREGYAKSYLKIAGRWEDHLLFARTNFRD
jgi:[ribosomal protein S5]-alanine N-acetyltransferase